MDDSEMKKCPFCAEEIRAAAVKCRYCGELLFEEPKSKKKWYFKSGSLIVSFLVIGPFALPLLWVNPHISKFAKVFWSVLIVGVTYGAMVLMKDTYSTFKEYFDLVMPVR